MKILLREAFDSSMPKFIQDWMKQNPDSYNRVFNRTHNRADFMKDFDPSSAIFQDVTNLSVNTLREYLKAGSHVIFAEVDVDSFSGPVTVAIYSDLNNSTNKLKLVGNGANKLKEKSFKWIIEHSTAVYSTPTNTEVANVRAARINARKGLISRDGQSAQNTDHRFNWDADDWKKDASGYWYNANRLAKKLADMHANDVGYYTKKAAEIFLNMANTYAEGVKTLAADPDINFDTFGDGFESKTRQGQRILSDTGNKMKQINEYAESYMYSLEDVNKVRSDRGEEPITEEEFNESQQYLLRRLTSGLAEIQQKMRELNELF